MRPQGAGPGPWKDSCRAWALPSHGMGDAGMVGQAMDHLFLGPTLGMRP